MRALLSTYGSRGDVEPVVALAVQLRALGAEERPGAWPRSFVIGEVNQQARFGRVAAVVHHGGAGTTTTATRADAPQVVAPQAGGDQPYRASMVAELGLGAHPTVLCCSTRSAEKGRERPREPLDYQRV